MKKDLVLELLNDCDLTCETEINCDETTIYAYNDELEFEMYVVFNENKKGIEISSPLTPEFENASDEVMNMIDDFYEKNQTMVDLVVSNELYAILENEDCEEKDIKYCLSDFLSFFAEEEYINSINDIIEQIMKDNNIE